MTTPARPAAARSFAANAPAKAAKACGSDGGATLLPPAHPGAPVRTMTALAPTWPRCATSASYCASRPAFQLPGPAGCSASHGAKSRTLRAPVASAASSSGTDTAPPRFRPETGAAEAAAAGRTANRHARRAARASIVRRRRGAGIPSTHRPRRDGPEVGAGWRPIAWHTMSATITSLLDGRPAPGAPGGLLARPNPADTADVVGDVWLGDAATFVDACTRARAAQRDWAATPAPVRGRAIQQAGRLVEDNMQALARIVTREVGKPYAEALGEVQEVVDTCSFFLSEGRRLYGQTVPSEMPDKQLFTFRAPVGVAAIVTAGNFPVAVPSWYLVPALLCGNGVVWKPSEDAAACADALARLLLHAGLPEGVLQLVLAGPQDTAAGLEQALDARLVDKVGFTGSTAVGRRIGELCGRHLQSPCLELGGKNPLVVLEDADLDLAVEGALFSGFGTAGQRCTSLGTAIVHERVHDEFVRRLAQAVQEAPVGDPAAPVLFGPMLHERFLRRFESDWLGLIRDHHALHGSTAVGRITRAAP